MNVKEIKLSDDRLIDSFKKLTVHDHLCLIYKDDEELFASIVPFIKTGLEQGEKCICIVDNSTTQRMLDAMEKGEIDVDTAIKSGALSILDKYTSCLKEGAFEPDRMLLFLKDAVGSAKEAGFNALRVTVDMACPAEVNTDVEMLIEYEANLNFFFSENDITAICQYNQKYFSPDILIDIVRTHPIVIHDSLVCTNSYYSLPEKYLKPNQLYLEVDRMLNSIRDREERERELTDSEKKFRIISATAQDAIIMADDKDTIIYWNKASENIFGYSKEEAIGKYLHKLIIPEELHEKHLSGFKKFRETGEGSVIGKRVELPAVTKDGTVISIELSLSAINIRGRWDAIGMIRNITERKRVDEELKRIAEERDRNINEMKQLMDFATVMKEEIHEQELIKHVAHVFKENFHADIIAMLMLDREKDILYVPVIHPSMPAENLIKTEALVDPSLCSVFRTGREFVVNDVTKDISCECISDKLEKGGYVCLPLIAGGLTIGAVLLVNNERIYEDSQHLLTTMASHAGLAAADLQRVRLMESTKHASITDGLTGIYNRRFFDETLEKQIALAKRLSKSLSILIADLDYFKKFNDTYGHTVGDVILKRVTALMRHSTRSSDILARYGGEEFVVIMPDTDIVGAMKKAKRMCQQVESASFDNVVEGQSLHVTLSVGVASFPENGTEFDELLRTADNALYKAKEEGRNRVEAP